MIEMAGALLTLKNLYKYYTGGSAVVMGLNNIDLSFERGEFVAVTGESGSGKSTLAHVLSGILPYESGEMYVDGHPTSHFDSGDWECYRRDSISFISQNYGILAGSTVFSNVVSALRISGMDKLDAKKKARELLELVELWDMRSRRAAKLSSGQKQRLSIARALAKPAPILIADEPTGNLDPENSRKVIQLLAQAASERLVILITHDFQEAEDCATRRITLQDGVVSADTQLRERYEQKQAEPAPKKPQKALSAYVSAIQISSRPMWSALVLTFFALTAFAVFAFLGTFIVNLDDTNTRLYDNTAFLNGDKTRIVVQRPDKQPLSDSDLEAILGVKYAEALEKSGYLTDVSYAYRPDVDYQIHYSVTGLGGAEYSVKESVELNGEAMSFMRTVPDLADGRDFLTGGRLPENMYEAVLAGDAEMIGQVIGVYVRDIKTWNAISYVYIEVTVVGVTDYGTGLYFSEEMGRVFTNFMMSGGKLGESYMIAPMYQQFCLQNTSAKYLTEDIAQIENAEFLTLSDGECLLSADLLARYGEYLRRQDRSGEPIVFWIKNNNLALRITDENYDEVANNPDYFLKTTAIASHSSPFNGLVLVNPDTFDKLAWEGNSNQVSLFISDYAYTDRVLESLNELGYTAISPFKQCSTEKNAVKAAQRMQTLCVCLAALAAIVILQILVLRELFGIQKESYKTLADIGLRCKTASLSLLWQVLLFALGGQLLGFAAISVCSALGVQRIISVTRYLPAGYRLILSLVHLSVSLFAGAWVNSGMKRRVYPDSSKSVDLKTDGGEAEI